LNAQAGFAAFPFKKPLVTGELFQKPKEPLKRGTLKGARRRA
jgi:hypothetical protein